VQTGPLVLAAQRCLDQVIELGPDRLSEFDWSQAPAIEVSNRL
jgi:hypothetical protein